MRGPLAWLLFGSLAREAVALCPNACNRNGYCTGLTEFDTCICAPGFSGDGCQFHHCPRGDDPMTEGQGLRTFSLTTAAIAGSLGGNLRIGFNDKTTLMPARASEISNALCARIFTLLPGISRATCTRRTYDELRESATWEIAIDAWSAEPVDALIPHKGNPPLRLFSCDVADVVTGTAPTCVLKDVVATNIKEHVECSNHGSCNLGTGLCQCDSGWRGEACTDNEDSGDVATHAADGPFFKGTVLRLRTSRPPSSDFTLLRAVAGGADLLTLDGLGNLDVLQRITASNGLRVARGGAEVDGGVTVRGAATFDDSLRVGETLLAVGGAEDAKTSLHVSSENVRVNAAFEAAADAKIRGELTAYSNATLEGDLWLKGALLAAKGARVSGRIVVDATSDADGAALDVDVAGPAVIAALKSGGLEVFTVSAAAVVSKTQLRVESGGLSVSAGGLIVSGGGAEIFGGLTLKSGSLVVADGFKVDDGGFVSATSKAGGAVLAASATHAQFAGTLLELAAPGQSVLNPLSAASLRLVHATVGGFVAFTVDGTGRVACGAVETAKGVTAGGAFLARESVAFEATRMKAAKSITIDASKTAFVHVLDDGAAAANEVTLLGGAAAGHVLMIKNSDAQRLTFKDPAGESVPPGKTAIFVQTTAKGWSKVSATVEAGDLRRLEGIESLEAAADLDIGAFTFRATQLAAANGKQDRLAFFGAGGVLSFDNDLAFENVDAADERGGRKKLRVARLEVSKGVDGTLAMGGNVISDARLERGSATNFETVSAKLIRLDAEPGSSTMPPKGMARVALFVEGGRLDARADVRFDLETREFFVHKLAGHAVTGDVDQGGYLLKDAKIRGGSIGGIDHLDLRELRFDFTPAASEMKLEMEDVTKIAAKRLALNMHSLLAIGENGTVVPALRIKATQDGSQLNLTSLVLESIESDVDFRGHRVSNAHLEGGSAAGLEFIATDAVLVGTLDPPEGWRAVVVSGPGGTLEQEPGLLVDATSGALRVPAALNVGADSTIAGSLVVSGSVMGSGAYVDSSDARFKVDLRAIDADEALFAVSNLTAYRYRYDTAAFPDRGFVSDRDDVGFIAQQIEYAFPELVTTAADGFKYVAYARFTPLLAASVAALARQNADLRAESAKLRLDAEATDRRLAALEEAVATLLRKEGARQPPPRQ
ncbi:hypothetical protein M885DRAFT_519470 [Pelagophyceae sp. CCMP2097]|nr:hypothetical protein M885DRAFT_519470 [Pelagophyceae sp. CCMP2097]